MLAPNQIWKQSPVLRCLVPLMAGIIFYYFFPVQNWLVPGVVIIILLTLLFIFSAISLTKQFHFNWIRGLIIYAWWAATGILLCYFQDAKHQQNWYGHFANANSKIIMQIAEPPVEKPKTYKALLQIKYVVSNKNITAVNGKAICYFIKDSSSKALQYGDELIIDNNLENIRNSGNPGGFDYVAYCARQNIFQQAFLRDNQWRKINSLQKYNAQYYLFEARNFCIRTLEKYIPGKKESAIAEALLIGYRDNLDKEMVQAYANTGVVHIIAISGLHLGLIYLLLLGLLFPIKENIIAMRWLKAVVVLSFLWSFALLTGAPGSVLRAAVMFSMIAIGRFLLNRSSTIYNTLAASAFLLLCYNPNLLFDVGFQLSYFAVLGIVIFQKPFYNLLYFRYWLPDKLWALASVSLAAQIFTAPACLYYFHQFPLLFLVSNMVAVPLSSIILFGLIAVIIISFWSWAALWMGKLISVLIIFMNTVIIQLDQYNWSRITGISITLLETVLLYFIFIAILSWIFHKQAKSFVVATFGVLILIIIFSFNSIKQHHQKKIIVYNIPGYRAIECVEDKQIYFSGDSAVLQIQQIFRQQLLPSHISFNAALSANNNQHYFIKNNLLQFYNKRLWIIDSSFSLQQYLLHIKVDYVIISHNPPITMAQLSHCGSFEKIIFDASNSLWKIRKWKSECEELNLPHFSVPDQGAFTVNF